MECLICLYPEIDSKTRWLGETRELAGLVASCQIGWHESVIDGPREQRTCAQTPQNQ